MSAPAAPALPPALDGTLAALADPARRRIVELLRERPRRAGELAAALSTSPPTTSRHLRVLRRGGLVEESRVEEDARVRLYRLRPEPFEGLHAWLEHIEGFWADPRAAFKAHAEGEAVPPPRPRRPRRRRPRR